MRCGEEGNRRYHGQRPAQKTLTQKQAFDIIQCTLVVGTPQSGMRLLNRSKYLDSRIKERRFP